MVKDITKRIWGCVTQVATGFRRDGFPSQVAAEDKSEVLAKALLDLRDRVEVIEEQHEKEYRESEWR